MVSEILRQNGYATAFFGATFFGYEELNAYLTENHSPEMMDYYPQP